MLLFGDKKFIQSPFENEEELDGVVAENYEYIFGPIDNIFDDLADWAKTLKKNSVNIWLIKKYIEVGNPRNIIYELPEEYKPFIDTEEENTIIEGNTERKIRTYNISVYDLIQAGLLKPGD